MSDSLFNEGGPNRIRRTGGDTSFMHVSIPEDRDGRIARECPNQECSPGYFKVRMGTGITEQYDTAFCPYCRNESDPEGFETTEQGRYATDVATQEAELEVGRMFDKAFRLGPTGRRSIGGKFFSMEVSNKAGSRRQIRRPIEEELLRAVVCPHCGLDHIVFGLANWCPDCGRDIFLTHVQAECEVVQAILADIDRRRTELGPRVAARDIENCLEDVVSTYEAVLKAMYVRARRESGGNDEDIQRSLQKKIKNAFQNVEKSAEAFESEFNVPLLLPDNPDLLKKLGSTFGKRHPITHNLGVVDRKYLETALSAEKEGREIRVTIEEINEALSLSLVVFGNLHDRLFHGPEGRGSTA